MPEFLTEEWFEEVMELASDESLPKTVGVNLKIGFEINKTPKDGELNGKVIRCCVEIISGQLKKFEMEKSSSAEVSVRSEYKYMLAVLKGELEPEVGYMQGVIKLDDAYEKVIYGLRDFWDSEPWISFFQKVRSSL